MVTPLPETPLPTQPHPGKLLPTPLVSSQMPLPQGDLRPSHAPLLQPSPHPRAPPPSFQGPWNLKGTQIRWGRTGVPITGWTTWHPGMFFWHYDLVTLEHFTSQGTRALGRDAPWFTEQVGSQLCNLSAMSSLRPGQQCDPHRRVSTGVWFLHGLGLGGNVLNPTESPGRTLHTLPRDLHQPKRGLCAPILQMGKLRFRGLETWSRSYCHAGGACSALLILPPTPAPRAWGGVGGAQAASARPPSLWPVDVIAADLISKTD